MPDHVTNAMQACCFVFLPQPRCYVVSLVIDAYAQQRMGRTWASCKATAPVDNVAVDNGLHNEVGHFHCALSQREGP